MNNKKVKRTYMSRKEKKRIIVGTLAFVACGFFMLGMFFWVLWIRISQAPETVAKAAEPAAAVQEEQKELTLHIIDPEDVELIGRTIWGEAGGIESAAERAAVAWCILNRVDSFGQTIEEVVTAEHQFVGYRPTGDCPKEHLELAADVLVRWYAEKDGAEDVGRVLPSDYLFFIGDGEHNHFSIEWKSSTYWNWSLPDPYITA